MVPIHLIAGAKAAQMCQGAVGMAADFQPQGCAAGCRLSSWSGRKSDCCCPERRRLEDGQGAVKKNR
jgi:hypothetical protein